MSVYTGSAQRHIPEDGILHNHRRENLKSYIEKLTFAFLYTIGPIERVLNLNFPPVGEIIIVD
jgi:hypothetical protein